MNVKGRAVVISIDYAGLPGPTTNPYTVKAVGLRLLSGSLTPGDLLLSDRKALMIHQTIGMNIASLQSISQEIREAEEKGDQTRLLNNLLRAADVAKYINDFAVSQARSIDYASRERSRPVTGDELYLGGKQGDCIPHTEPADPKTQGIDPSSYPG